MSYLVIARKYRPMAFDDVVGQEHVTTTLKNAIESKRIAHAYIFSGPRGVGKTTSARILAKALNCENGGPTLTPCNRCTSCIEVTSGRSMDVLEIDGASNRGIDEIRNLRDNVRYMPVHGGFKIYIIDEFHMITKDAFNALLKTLEEPPPQVVFIFATTEPHKILPTILSRCQRFDFRRVPIEKIVARLEFICRTENIETDQESLFAMARLADGGMRDALTLLDQVISFCGTTIRIEEVRKSLGIISQDAYFDLVDLIIRHDTKSVFEFTVRISEAGWDLTEFLHGFLEHLRSILLAKSCGESSLTETFEGYRNAFVRDAARISETDLLRMMSLIADSIQRLKWSIRPRIQFELLLLKLARMEASHDLAELLRQIGTADDESAKSGDSRVEKKKSELTGEPSIAGVLPSAVEESKVPRQQILTLDGIRQRWPEFVDKVKLERMRLGAILEHTYPRGVDKEVLRVGFEHNDLSDIHAEMLHKEKDYLSGVALALWSQRLRIQCDLSPDVSVAMARGAVKEDPGQDNLFDHYPVVNGGEETRSTASDTSELFAYVRQLQQQEPLKTALASLDAELVRVEPKS